MTNQNQLIVRKTSNQQLPTDGPKFVRLPFNFSTVPAQTVDLIQYVARAFISSIQTMYVDNSNNPQTLVIAFGQPVAQSLSIPPLAQGYFSILVPEPVMQIATTGTPSDVSVTFINVPIAPAIWYPAGNAALKFDASGNLETADQNLAPAIIGGIVQTSGSGGGGGGGAGNVPNTITHQSLTPAGHQNLNDLLTQGAPTDPWYMRILNISLSGDATLAAAGEYTVSIYLSAENFALAAGQLVLSKTIWLPGAGTPINGAFPIFDFEDLQTASTSVRPYFALFTSASLATGQLDVTAGGGLVSAG